MINIKKIFIKNFKGIHSPQVVDFSNATLTILDGPNGFGKTTIFDTIEICLRGKLERTVTYDHVTKKNSDHKKPFYQNKKGENVILKVWLHDDVEDSDHIIIKYLDKDHDGKVGTSKAFRPDSWSILGSYYSKDIDSFSTKDDIAGYEGADQKLIDSIIFGSNELSLVNLFPLFNYLQQEENIYFLKKDEEKKKNELDFLFQTQIDAQNLDIVDEFLKNIRSCKSDIKNRLNELGEISQVNKDVEYKELFPSKSLFFDGENIFNEVGAENLTPTYERARNELDEIVLFLESFNIDEYKKSKLKESLKAVLDDERIQNAFILQFFFTDEVFNNIRILKEKIDTYKIYATKLDNSTITGSEVLSLQFDEAFINSMQAVMLRKSSIDSQISQLGKIIIDLNESREKVIKEFSELSDVSVQEPNCPVCNTRFNSLEELSMAVLEKTNLLKSLNETQINSLEQINREIQLTVVEPIKARINVFIQHPDNILDGEFYNLITSYKGFKEIIQRFNLVLSDNNLDFSELIPKSIISVSDFNLLQTRLKTIIQTTFDGISIQEEKLVNRRLFKDLFEENQALFENTSLADFTAKQIYLNQAYLDAKFNSASILDLRLKSFEKIETQVSEIQKVLDKAIKKYKMDMIEKIKIPFYIFSGKIIQNYQQGHGIFIDMNEKTNRVRFLADCNSDHDIIHHLSSGQLAVVSIAFCLALNKVYSTNNNFKFLAIDDPVQTLDDINVHSFIELMRHDFKDYQILLSTHEEKVASYMDYKFKKFGFISERQRVQKLFYTDVN